MTTFMRAEVMPFTSSNVSPDGRIAVGDVDVLFQEETGKVQDFGADLFSDANFGKEDAIAMRKATFDGVNVGQAWDKESIVVPGTFAQGYDVTAFTYAYAGKIGYSFGVMDNKNTEKIVMREKTIEFQTAMSDLFQVVHADFFADVFDQNWYDGVPFASDGHTYASNAQGLIAMGTLSPVWSNVITGAPTYGNLLKACVQMENQYDRMGRPYKTPLQPSIVRCHPTQLEYINQELNYKMGTTPHNDFNDKNTLESRGLKPVAYPYMPTKNMWWIEAAGNARKAYRYIRRAITLRPPFVTGAEGNIEQVCWFEVATWNLGPQAYVFSTGV